MSKIGKLPIQLPASVTVNVAGDKIGVKGPKGELAMELPAGITVKQEDGALLVARANEEHATRALHGLVRSLLNNLVEGVTAGFAKTLEINGVGYRAELKGQSLVLHIGFSHLVEVPFPPDIDVKLDKNQIIISGIDKQKVGQVAAIIRSKRPPEPYKGKGIKYLNEVIRRKAGKTAAATGKPSAA
jgi:large subunit ribosomal protein L6